MNSAPALQASALTKTFGNGDSAVAVLSKVDLTLRAGEKLAIVGRSGSGKSTLLHLLAGLDTPDSGSIVVDGVDLAEASNDERARVRCRAMGFVYQNHHLLPEFNALENVAMPLRIGGRTMSAAADAARELLAAVGLEHRLTHLPSALSGGERQRVAVARAIAGDPQVVLADEPTGNLDVQNAGDTMALLHSLSAAHGTAFIVVTHDQSMLAEFDRVLILENGALS